MQEMKMQVLTGEVGSVRESRTVDGPASQVKEDQDVIKDTARICEGREQKSRNVTVYWTDFKIHALPCMYAWNLGGN